MLTRQEVFDKVVIGARKQRKHSKTSSRGGISTICKYHTDTGLKCFIGMLISDNLYHKNMEGRPVNELFDHFPYKMEEAGLNEKDAQFYMRLQAIHDARTPVRSWERAFEVFAKKWDLKITKEGKRLDEK